MMNDTKIDWEVINKNIFFVKIQIKILTHGKMIQHNKFTSNNAVVPLGDYDKDILSNHHYGFGTIISDSLRSQIMKL